MKILIYTLNYEPELTGIGKYNGEMAQWLRREGYDVRVVTALPYYPDWKVFKGYSKLKYKKEVIDGVNVYRCPLWVPGKQSGIKRILHLLSFAFLSIPAIFLQFRWKPDAVFVTEPPLFCTPIALMFSRIVGAKTWLHVQDFEVDAAFELNVLKSAKMRSIVSRLERMLMAKFDCISTISPKMISVLKTKLDHHPNTVLFPNWVDIEQIYPLSSVSDYRGILSIDDDQTVFLYSGNMGDKQGLELIIESAKILKDNHKIVFVMCGNGSAYDKLREYADGLNNVRWLELQPVDRLNELLNLADVHLLPQKSGAADLVMPSKLTGMMASGKPILALAEPGTQIADALIDSGICIMPDDIESLVVSIRKLAQSETLKDRLGVNAREYAIRNLSRSSLLNQFEKDLSLFLSESY